MNTKLPIFLTEEQEMKMVLKYLNMTQKEFDKSCQDGYNKVIEKRKKRDQ
jgi:hypothetical protein